MIRQLKIQNFKGFRQFEIAFDQLNLLVGGNNSGKTTVFHALQLFFWCLEKTATEQGGHVVLRKTQVGETSAVPIFRFEDLFYQQATRAGRGPARIVLTVAADGIPDVEFEIYGAYARNFMVSGKDLQISAPEFEALRALRPVFIPGTVGITVKEDLLRPVAQERLLREGNQSQVLRNIIYRVKQKGVWDEFSQLMRPLFEIADLQIPFQEEQDEWLTVQYKENEKWYDLVSAGSGFLQLVNIFGFLFLYSPAVALIDEPDSHMHDDLQRLTFGLFERFADARKTQFVISTHSSTMIDQAGLDRVLIIDKNANKPMSPGEDELVEALGMRGIDFIPSKVVDALRTKKALFVEGRDSDYQKFIAILGATLDPNFAASSARLTIFQTEGLTAKWPFDAIEAFEQLIGVDLDYVYLSDRDFLLPHEVTAREQRANHTTDRLIHTARRNRESYLLDPGPLARVLEKKWAKRHPDEAVPAALTAPELASAIVEFAKEDSSNVQAALLVQKEAYLREDRNARMPELLAYFAANYTELVARGEIPYLLLDSKAALARLRQSISDDHRLQFTDREVFEEFTEAEIPDDIRRVIGRISAMFRPQAVEAQEPVADTDEIANARERDLVIQGLVDPRAGNQPEEIQMQVAESTPEAAVEDILAPQPNAEQANLFSPEHRNDI
jgi:AAA ATPase domain/AAA domain, putative AbiEii toxin, Type IV TA system